jgi:hypothetical protein
LKAKAKARAMELRQPSDDFVCCADCGGKRQREKQGPGAWAPASGFWMWFVDGRLNVYTFLGRRRRKRHGPPFGGTLLFLPHLPL